MRLPGGNRRQAGPDALVGLDRSNLALLGVDAGQAVKGQPADHLTSEPDCRERWKRAWQVTSLMHSMYVGNIATSHPVRSEITSKCGTAPWCTTSCWTSSEYRAAGMPLAPGVCIDHCVLFVQDGDCETVWTCFKLHAYRLLFADWLVLARTSQSELGVTGCKGDPLQLLQCFMR